MTFKSVFTRIAYILKDQLQYKTHTLFHTITHASHTNISANELHRSQFHRENGAHGTEKLLLKLK